ncbi:MAG: hypothetical protein ACR2G0_12465 [Chthoniobacterales bacterium]
MKNSWRVGLNWLCAAFAFFLVCAGIGWFFPKEVNGITLKTQRFAVKKDQFDIVFIGSSRIYHGVSPKVFDRLMRASGHNWRSFNAAMDGMNTAEGFALARRLLSLHPKKLKFIFLELQAYINAGTPIGDETVKERDVYWRDWDSLVEGFRKFTLGLTGKGAGLPGIPFSFQRFDRFAPVLLADTRLWVRNLTNFGEGLRIVQSALASGPSWLRPAAPLQPAKGANLPKNWDGYFAMSRPMSNATLATYRKGFSDAQHHPPFRPPDPIMRSELQHFVVEMKRYGIEVIFLVPPSVGGARGSAFYAPKSDLLFDYDDLTRYAPYYAEPNRLDTEHLNGRGAELFTRTLADDFTQALALRPR